MKTAIKTVVLGAMLASWVVVLGFSGISGPAEAAAGRWKPAPGTGWQWQLSSQPGTLVKVDAYDLDGFDTSAQTVARIHRNGGKAICYISVGSWENWRPDKNKFPQRVLGNNYDGWPGERWLDVRQLGALAPIMGARMGMCKKKGFDAVEPDNMDNFQNKTGFRITPTQQLRYNRLLARAAHSRGLSIAMKNDQSQVGGLVNDFDFAITEDCFDQGWCGKMLPFIRQGKAVLAAEYTDTGAAPQNFCGDAKRFKFDAILKKRNLGAWRRAC